MSRRHFWIIFVFGLLSFTLSACAPRKATVNLTCDLQKETCQVKVTNPSHRQVDLRLDVGLEYPTDHVTPQYSGPTYADGYRRVEKWIRQMNGLMSVEMSLRAGETKTYVFEFPAGWDFAPGQVLVQALVTTDPPNGFSVAYGHYHDFVILDVPEYNPAVTITCTNGLATVKVNRILPEWGGRAFALYLNDNTGRHDQFQIFGLAPGQTFISDPLPEGTSLVAVEINGIREEWYNNQFDYHPLTRTYCTP